MLHHIATALKRRQYFKPAAAMLAIALCAGQTAFAAQPTSGGTLTIATFQAPRHLNPAVQSGNSTGAPGSQLFASLLRADGKWNLLPYLAESWSMSPDGLSMTLKLVNNASFHDGKPITSADVAFSIMTVKENHPFQTMLAPVTRVETPDVSTVIIRLSTPHPALPLALSTPALVPIIPKHIYGDGKDVKSHPANSVGVVGSGPYKLVEFKPGQHVILERFNKFFIPGRPYLDRIIYSNNPDTSNVMIAAERGDVQMIGYLENARDIQRLAKMPQMAVTAEGYSGIGPLSWVAFNMKRKPLSERPVRQAISYAIDRKFISKSLQAGLSIPATGPIVQGTPFYSADVAKYDVDLKKSEEMLDAAGYKRDASGKRFTVTIDYPPGANESQKNIAEYLKSQLKKIGVIVEVRASPDLATWTNRIAAHDFDMTMDAVFNWGDPVIGVHRTYLSSNIRNIIWSNTQSYSNPKVDSLLAHAASEMDPVKRKSDYAEFQKIVTEDVPVAWISVIPYHTAYNKSLRNPPTTIWGMLAPLDEVYRDQAAK
ncbi:ABC transporter substrate-binding protein [Noviherbaspirillum soli]|uniref:ABC transporter substrate-binding protein n=1 Tax=Noviherbaspirillum soli TaxID=1064518 RepID=UPI001E362168|nr:ABC transporter substrate-binding protein [Noviherbaspirillum soli]